MISVNITKQKADTIINAIEILGFEIECIISNMDINLYNLGFVDDIPCKLEINSSDEQEEKMLDMLDELEIAARVDNDKSAEEKYQKVIELQTLLLNGDNYD